MVLDYGGVRLGGQRVYGTRSLVSTLHVVPLRRRLTETDSPDLANRSVCFLPTDEDGETDSANPKPNLTLTPGPS